MTRQQQINVALKLLAPPRQRRAECRYDIEAAIRWVSGTSEAASAFKAFSSKENREQLKQHKTALRNAVDTYDKIDVSIKPWFYNPVLEAPGNRQLFNRQSNTIDEMLAGPVRPQKRDDATLAKAAIPVTYSLCAWWGHKASLTRGGRWEQLINAVACRKVAAFEHMRRYKKNPTPIIDKLKFRDGLAFVTRDKPDRVRYARNPYPSR